MPKAKQKKSQPISSNKNKNVQLIYEGKNSEEVAEKGGKLEKPKSSVKVDKEISTSAATKKENPPIQPKPAAARRVSAPQISPENYIYVYKDLKLIGILAILMFGTIIVLHFTLNI